MAPRSSTPSSQLTSDDLCDIIAEHLPAWLKACAGDTEVIAMHEEAFGTSGDELFLLGCAIKYATRQGKIVHVTCGDQSVASSDPSSPFAVTHATYRERKRRSKGTPRLKKQPPRTA